MLARTLKVALAFPTGIPHLQKALRGIKQYGRQRGWRFVMSPETQWLRLAQLKHWTGDGIICWINTEREAALARQLPCPVVNLSGALRHPRLPRVRVDYEQVGVMGAEHLLSRGFDRLAYYGLRGVWYAQLIGQGFIRRARQAGIHCTTFHAASSFSSRALHQHQGGLERWLKGLELPIGIMASHDERARMISEACLELGLRVPHDVAILSMNNDEIICEFCEPSLTSISRDPERVGHEAAAMLDHLMHGQDTPREIVIAPDAVIERASTDVTAATDPRLAAAIDFIRRNLSDPFTIEDMVAQLHVSRRWLQYRFQEEMGCSPRQFIDARRIERAREILSRDGQMRMGDIARACGFRDVRRFRQTFNKHTGHTPQQYRTQRPMT